MTHDETVQMIEADLAKWDHMRQDLRAWIWGQHFEPQVETFVITEIDKIVDDLLTGGRALQASLR